MAALAASGLYSSSPSSIVEGHAGGPRATVHNPPYGQRNSPLTSVSETVNFPRDISSSQASAAMVTALAQLQSGGMAKALASGHRHTTGK